MKMKMRKRKNTKRTADLRVIPEPTDSNNIIKVSKAEYSRITLADSIRINQSSKSMPIKTSYN